jgi:hypothetical protein
VFSNSGGDNYIFGGFNGRLVAKNHPGKTTPTVMAIK